MTFHVRCMRMTRVLLVATFITSEEFNTGVMYLRPCLATLQARAHPILLSNRSGSTRNSNPLLAAIPHDTHFTPQPHASSFHQRLLDALLPFAQRRAHEGHAQLADQEFLSYAAFSTNNPQLRDTVLSLHLASPHASTTPHGFRFTNHPHSPPPLPPLAPSPIYPISRPLVSPPPSFQKR